MILYVDLEHEGLRGQNSNLWQYFATKTLETKYCIEAIAGELCLIIHYSRLTPALLQNLNVRAIVVGGHYTALPHYDETALAGLRSIFKEGSYPTLGICGGYQLLAQAFGAEFGPIVPWPDNPDSFPDTPLPPDASEVRFNAHRTATRQEQGFMPVRLLQPHPLVAGLPQEPVFFQLHSWEVKMLPKGFECLAESDLCSIQMIAHKDAPLFGTQFHPEQYTETYPDGRTIFENFFKIAGILS